MPTYEVTDSRGRVLELEGEREPTQAEIANAFDSAFATEGVALQSETTPSLRAASVAEPGVATPTLAATPALSSPTQAFPTQEPAMLETAKLPALTAGEAEAMLTTPQVAIPRVGEPGTVTRGLSEVGAGLVEQALLTPAAPLQTLALAVPGVRLAAGTLFTAAGAKAAAEKAGEASVTGNPQTIAEAAGLGVMTGLGALGAAGDAMARVAPATAAATKATSEALGKAATPTEPIGIVPEGARKLAELRHGQELIDQERIKTAIARQDVMPGRDWIASPEFEFRNDPLAKPLVTALNEAELSYKSRVAHVTERFDELKATLSETDQLALTKALKGAQAGDEAALANLTEPQRAAWSEIRQYYDDTRARVIESKQESVLNELTGPQQNALRAVRDGVPLEEAAKANGLRPAGRDIVKSAAAEMDELATWGIEDYTTNIERGSYRVVTEDGTTVAIGESRPAAAIKADRWLKEHPEVKSVTLTDEFNPGVEFPTQLSQGQYYRLVAKLSDSLDAAAVEIQDLLRSQGSSVTVKPTNKYAGPMQRRRNILKGEDNVFDVLPVYAHVMEKKLALDPVLREARSTLPKLAENTRAQITDLIGDVKGRKTIGDKIVDYALAPYGLKPFAYSRALDTTRQVMAKLKLGYRPVAAVVNRISGAQHTWTKTGTRYLLEGNAFLKTPEGEALLQANKPYLGIEAAFVHESAKPRAQEPLYKPLGMFQAAERFNRPESFAALYKYAQGELGLTGDAAVQFARNATRFGQFTYNTASLPRALRGPTGRFLFQFKPYLVKELEFVSSLRGEEIPRYLTAFLTIGGPRAALYTLKSLPLLGAAGIFATTEDWLNRKAPAASRGVGGALGVDVSPSVAFQFPTTPSELLGPTVSDLARLWTDVVGPALQGENRDLSDVRKWATRLAPAINYWAQLVEAVGSDSGWVTGSRGRPSYKPTKADLVKFAVGAKPLEKSIAEVEAKFLRDQERVLKANNQRAIDQFLDAVQAKDGARIGELAKELSDAGVSVDSVKAAARARHIEPQLRLLRSLSRPTKAREAERFAPDAEPVTP